MSQDALIAKFNLIAAQIRHEDGLIGQRISWLVISQSFLFGTFVALVVQKGVVGPAARAVKLLLILIPLVGVLAPVIVLVAVGAAIYAIAQWRAEHDRLSATPEARQLDWPDLTHQTSVEVLGHLLPIAIAVVLALAWAAIMIQMSTD